MKKEHSKTEKPCTIQNVSDSDSSEFYKAVEWFSKLPYKERMRLCLEASDQTQTWMPDALLVPLWKKHCH